MGQKSQQIQAQSQQQVQALSPQQILLVKLIYLFNISISLNKILRALFLIKIAVE